MAAASKNVWNIPIALLQVGYYDLSMLAAPLKAIFSLTNK